MSRGLMLGLLWALAGAPADAPPRRREPRDYDPRAPRWTPDDRRAGVVDVPAPAPPFPGVDAEDQRRTRKRRRNQKKRRGW